MNEQIPNNTLFEGDIEVPNYADRPETRNSNLNEQNAARLSSQYNCHI